MGVVAWRFSKGVISEPDILKVEITFQIGLPDMYKEIVREHNGGRPLPNRFDTERSEKRMIKSFLPVDERPGNILEVYEWIKDRIPPLVIPFANDPGGNYLCFDYRKSFDTPEIVFWDHETCSVERISIDFPAFIAKIY